MKHILFPLCSLLLAAGLTACSADDDLLVDVDARQATVKSQPVDSLFVEKDETSKTLPTTLALSAQSLYKLLSSPSLTTAHMLEMGETNITDAQFAEIKAYVDANLKGSTQKETHNNIFNWLVKNLTYTYDSSARLDPYDVFTEKRCVCQGYANLCKTMLITQDIPAFCVNGQLGTVGAHAWVYALLDGEWTVSDPTNNQQYVAKNYTKYKDKLQPERVDVVLFEDEQFTYSFQERRLCVSDVKKCDGSALTVPYSVAGYTIPLFLPTSEIPSNITQIYFGSNIRTLGESEIPLRDVCPNVEEAFVAADNTALSSTDGVVYKGKSTNNVLPYYIPASIRTLVLRPAATIEKNTVYYLDKVEEIVISAGTTTVEAYAIEQCPNLRRVYISESVTSLDDQAIYRCPDDVEIVRVPTSIHSVSM